MNPSNLSNPAQASASSSSDDDREFGKCFLCSEHKDCQEVTVKDNKGNGARVFLICCWCSDNYEPADLQAELTSRLSEADSESEEEGDDDDCSECYLCHEVGEDGQDITVKDHKGDSGPTFFVCFECRDNYPSEKELHAELNNHCDDQLAHQKVRCEAMLNSRSSDRLVERKDDDDEEEVAKDQEEIEQENDEEDKQAKSKRKSPEQIAEKEIDDDRPRGKKAKRN